MSKLSSYDSCEHLKHKLWLKEGLRVKLAIWLPTTKNRESPQFPCVQVACDISLESSQQGLQLCFRLHLHRRCTHKIMGPQSHRSPNYGNFRTPTWVLVPWPCIKYIIRGKVVASPKSGPWWVLWICVCPWFVRAPKCSNYVLTNLLFGLCKYVWVIEVLFDLPSPISELQHAPQPPKCCKLGSAPQLFLLPLFPPLDSQLSPSRSLGVRQKTSCKWNHYL